MNDHRRMHSGALGNPGHRNSGHIIWEMCRFGLLAFSAIYCCVIPTPLPAQTSGAQPAEVHKRVYIPVSELETVLNRDKRGVLLSDDEFQKLVAAARKNAGKFQQSPDGVIVRSTQYDLVFDRTRLVIKARVAFTQFQPGWRMVPLSGRGTSVESATLDGEPARFLRRANDEKRSLELLSNEVGDHTLLLELSVPVAMVGSDQVAAVGLVPSAVSSMHVALPEKQHLVVDGLNVGRGADGAYQIPVGGRSEVSFRVTERKID
ncbi:MAG: hypothetical protein ABGZ17_26240, partial [Planctomycetaceae bacterium]